MNTKAEKGSLKGDEASLGSGRRWWHSLSRSPRRLMLLTALWIFLAEFLDMLLLEVLPELPPLVTAFADSLFLLLIVSPIYFFLYRPFRAQWKARRQIEEELRKSEELYRSLVENINFGIALVDADHKIVMTNKAQQRFFNQPADAFVGQKCYATLQGLDRACPSCPARETIQTGRSASVEMERQRADGTRRFVRLSTFPVSAADGRVERVIEVAEDITEGKLAEEEIRYLSQQLIRSTEEERKRLARDLHDEFGQILTTLQLGIQTLTESLPEMLSVQRAHCGRLSQLIDCLGDRVREITSRLRPSILDDMGLESALRWHVEQFGSEREELEIDFRVEGQTGKRLPVDIEIALYRLCQEALNNIAKHARARHVSIRLTFQETAVLLSVCDDGQGLKTAMAKKGGRGIGLLGMRERLAPLGGSLTVVSPTGGGTELRVDIPLTPEKEDG